MHTDRGRLIYCGSMRWSSHHCELQRTGLRLMLLSCMGSLQLVMPQSVPLSNFQAGRMLNFGGPQDVTANPAFLSGPFLDGACGYGQLLPYQWPFFALASISSNNSIATEASCSGCGACIEVQCVGQGCLPGSTTGPPSAVVWVADKCYNCYDTDIVMHYSIVEQLSDPSKGAAGIIYRRVDCQPDANIAVEVDLYRQTFSGYIRLLIKNVAGVGTLRTVDLRHSITSSQDDNQSQWTPMANVYGAAWQLTTLPPPPYDLDLIDDDGEQLLLRNAIPKSIEPGQATISSPGGGLFPTSEQFDYSPDNYSASLGPLPAPQPRGLAPGNIVAAPELLRKSPPMPAPAPAPLEPQARLPSLDSNTVTLVQDVPPSAILKGPPGQLVIDNKLPVSSPITFAAPGPAPQTEAGLVPVAPGAMQNLPAQVVAVQESVVAPGPPASALGAATGALFPITQIETSSNAPVLSAEGAMSQKHPRRLREILLTPSPAVMEATLGLCKSSPSFALPTVTGAPPLATIVASPPLGVAMMSRGTPPLAVIADVVASPPVTADAGGDSPAPLSSGLDNIISLFPDPGSTPPSAGQALIYTPQAGPPDQPPPPATIEAPSDPLATPPPPPSPVDAGIAAASSVIVGDGSPTDAAGLGVSPGCIGAGTVPTVYEVLQPNPSYSLFVQYCDQIGLTSLLQNGNASLTVFAPIDQAFQNATLQQLNPANQESLQAVIAGYISLGRRDIQSITAQSKTVTAASVGTSVAQQGIPLQMLSGSQILVSPSPEDANLQIQAGGSTIVITGFQLTCRSIVYTISSLLLP